MGRIRELPRALTGLTKGIAELEHDDCVVFPYHWECDGLEPRIAVLFARTFILPGGRNQDAFRGTPGSPGRFSTTGHRKDVLTLAEIYKFNMCADQFDKFAYSVLEMMLGAGSSVPAYPLNVKSQSSMSLPGAYGSGFPTLMSAGRGFDTDCSIVLTASGGADAAAFIAVLDDC